MLMLYEIPVLPGQLIQFIEDFDKKKIVFFLKSSYKTPFFTIVLYKEAAVETL